MKPQSFIAAALIAGSSFAFAAEDSFRSALMTIPPKYLGDIPLADRNTFIRLIGEDSRGIDTKEGWVHWFSDGRDVRATSMVWLKELPRADKSPLIFVHIAKPFSDGSKPEANQTFVLELTDEGWADVSKTVIPANVDMTLHFRPRKNGAVIEAAPWKEFERRDGRGKAWTYGERVMDLQWRGEKFIVQKPASKKFTKN